MPPKKGSGPSKKTELKQKQKVIEDKTFGMKNKNKSKAVQKKIKHIETNVMGDPRKLQREMAEREQRKLQKLAEKEREKELKQLFNVVPSAKDVQEQQAQAEGSEQGEGAEGTSDAPKEEKELKEEEALGLLAQIEEEMREEEEMTLEEIIDKERAKITDGTPVTLETFKQWKEFKRQQQTKENEKQKQLQEISFKKSGAGISGRHLFEYDRSVFVDDEEATDKIERVEMDDALFLDEEPAAEPAKEEEEAPKSEEEDYDPDTWQDPAKPPKNLLQEYMNAKKIKQYPTYETINTNGSGFLVKCILTHTDNKEIIPQRIYSSKKAAENNAALKALRYLQQLDKQAESASPDASTTTSS